MARGDVPVQGSVRRKPVSLKLGFADEDYGYALDLGLPIPAASMFLRDPAIKAEAVWAGARLGRSNAFARREGPLARILSEGGRWRQAADALAPTDSMMTHCADPIGAPELLHLRERMRAWRFYDHLRVDRDAPARRPQVGTHTPVLAGDGADLAAALQTVREIGDARALDAAVILDVIAHAMSRHREAAASRTIPMAPQAQGRDLVSTVGERVHEALLPSPGTMPCYMHQQEGRVPGHAAGSLPNDLELACTEPHRIHRPRAVAGTTPSVSIVAATPLSFDRVFSGGRRPVAGSACRRCHVVAEILGSSAVGKR